MQICAALLRYYAVNQKGVNYWALDIWRIVAAFNLEQFIYVLKFVRPIANFKSSWNTKLNETVGCWDDTHTHAHTHAHKYVWIRMI